jgi:hypothetical protein
VLRSIESAQPQQQQHLAAAVTSRHQLRHWPLSCNVRYDQGRRSRPQWDSTYVLLLRPAGRLGRRCSFGPWSRVPTACSRSTTAFMPRPPNLPPAIVGANAKDPGTRRPGRQASDAGTWRSGTIHKAGRKLGGLGGFANRVAQPGAIGPSVTRRDLASRGIGSSCCNDPLNLPNTCRWPSPPN